MATFADRIRVLGDEEFLDSIVVAHGFTAYGRDYDVMLLTVAALPSDVPIGGDDRHLYRCALSIPLQPCPRGSCAEHGHGGIVAEVVG